MFISMNICNLSFFISVKVHTSNITGKEINVIRSKHIGLVCFGVNLAERLWPLELENQIINVSVESHYWAIYIEDLALSNM